MDPLIVDRLLNWGVEGLSVLLIAGAGIAVAKWQLTKERRLLIASGINLAYGAVNELARKTPNKIDDKAVEALKQLAAYLETYGAPPPTAAEEQRALIAFNALHAQETLATASPK